MTRRSTRQPGRLRTSACLTALATLLLVGCGERGPRIVVLADTEPPTVTDVLVFPEQVTLFALGDTVRFTAAPLDSLGNVVDNVTVVWASLDVGIASIASDGLALARGQGQTVVTATVDDVVGRAFLAVSLQNAAPGLVPPAGRSP